MINVGTNNGHEERYQWLAPAYSSWRGWSVRRVMGYLRAFLERALVDVATRILIAMCKLNQSKNRFGGAELPFVLVHGQTGCNIFGLSLRWWVAELGQGCMSCYGLNCEKKVNRRWLS